MGARFGRTMATPRGLPCWAARMRAAKRQQAAENRAVETARRWSSAGDFSELESVIHRELDRLPDRYRLPVLLCDLEGRSYAEAARHLACPVGTVKSRLARARERLRARLLRRGLAPCLVARSAVFDFSGSPTVPAALAGATVEAGLHATASPAVSALALGTVKSMLLAKVKVPAALCLAAVILAAGITSAAGRPRGDGQTTVQAEARPQHSEPKKETPKAQVPQYAWQRTDRYEPPDFKGFFPENSPDAVDLTALWESGELQKKPRAVIMKLVRASLRGTVRRRDEILGWFGDQYIWSASPQDPAAIEIMYHAADYRGPCVHELESTPVYYGLSVVEPKPPAVLHALVDLCMHTTNPSDWGRIAWGARKQRTELLSYLNPYLAAPDQAMRERAAMLEKVLGEDPDHARAQEEWFKKQVQLKSAHRLPAIREALLSGSPAERKDALCATNTDMLWRIMDDSFIDAFIKCAADADVEVRKEVATTLGMFVRFGFGKSKTGEAIDALLALCADPDGDVRYAAAWQGLIPIPELQRKEVVKGLVNLAIDEHRLGDPQGKISRIASGLKRTEPETIAALDEILKGSDPAKAEIVRVRYKELTGRHPPRLARSDAERRKGYVKAYRELYEHLGAVYPNFKLKGIDWPGVGRELLPAPPRSRRIGTSVCWWKSSWPDWKTAMPGFSRGAKRRRNPTCRNGGPCSRASLMTGGSRWSITSVGHPKPGQPASDPE